MLPVKLRNNLYILLFHIPSIWYRTSRNEMFLFHSTCTCMYHIIKMVKKAVLLIGRFILLLLIFCVTISWFPWNTKHSYYSTKNSEMLATSCTHHFVLVGLLPFWFGLVTILFCKDLLTTMFI